MEEKTKFYHSTFGNQHVFEVGQKVECIYYHEYPRSYMKDAYKRKWFEIIIDRPFKPVKLGVVINDAGIHPYWLSPFGNEQYLLVKFKEYFLPKPIPISCITDAKEAVERMEFFLKKSIGRLGEKGYDFESFDKLTNQMNKAKAFTNQ